MSNEKQTSSGAPYPVLLIVGAALMVGGTWFSQNIHPEFIEKLAKQGIPVDIGEVLATIGVCLILFPVVNQFFLLPLIAAIKERNESLEKTFAEVEHLRDEMAKMKTAYESRLATTEANAREQIQNQIREAQILKQTLTEEATSRAEQLLQQAQTQIEQEKQSAITELRTLVVDLTLGATEKLLGESLDDARSRKLIDTFMTQEVSN